MARWKFATDINEENKKIKSKAQLKYAEWERKAWKMVKEWDGKWQKLSKPFLKRQFKFLSILGSAALDKKDLAKYQSIATEMQTVYSTAKVCDYKNPQKCDLELDPDLERIMVTSRDYGELEHVWKMWRNASGRPIRDHYKQFVSLANKAARLNGFDNMGDMWLYPYESDTFRKDIADLWE